jgi:hypothetical protein
LLLLMDGGGAGLTPSSCAAAADDAAAPRLSELAGSSGGGGGCGGSSATFSRFSCNGFAPMRSSAPGVFSSLHAMAINSRSEFASTQYNKSDDLQR